MKFSEYVMQELNERLEQRKVIHRIEKQILPLTLHILKVWLMPDSQDFNHWIKEIDNILSIIITTGSNVKTKKGYISYETLIEEYGDIITKEYIKDRIYSINIQYNQKFKFKNDIYAGVTRFYRVLWSSLGSGSARSKFLINKIKEIGDIINERD